MRWLPSTIRAHLTLWHSEDVRYLSYSVSQAILEVNEDMIPTGFMSRHIESRYMLPFSN